MEIRVNCPDSIHIPRVGKSDVKRRLYINPRKNAAHCFRCGFGTKDAAGLVQRLRLDVGLQDWGDAPEADRGEVRLPDDFTLDYTITPFGSQAMAYLEARNLSRLTIAAYGIGYCTRGPQAFRVVIPVIEDGALVTWQARDWTGTYRSKYMTPKGARPDAMFNYDRARGTGVLVLVEGIFDALRLPEYAIALLGKGWNDAKRAKILRAKPNTVYVMLDADAKQDAQAIHEDLAGMVPHVETLSLSSKDIGSASPEEVESTRLLCRATELAHAVAARGVQPPPRVRPEPLVSPREMVDWAG